MTALRGAQALLFHGGAGVRACALGMPGQVKIKVKGSGQECPLHTIQIVTAFGKLWAAFNRHSRLALLLRLLFQGDG
jgi:hypothetical protein